MSNDQPPPGPLWDYDDLLNLLSAERLGSYLNATEHNVELAFGLYEWSMRAAAEVMHTTGMVEVVVRNALDQQLTQWAAQRGAGSWLDTVPLDQRGLDDISKARGRATRFGRDEEVHGKVVAELSFGFWRFLVARRYLTSLWVPALGSAFSHCEDADLSARRDSVDSILQADPSGRSCKYSGDCDDLGGEMSWKEIPVVAGYIGACAGGAELSTATLGGFIPLLGFLGPEAIAAGAVVVPVGGCIAGAALAYNELDSVLDVPIGE